MQVIPPLKVLEQIYACRGCGAFLLTGGHIINVRSVVCPASLLGRLSRSRTMHREEWVAANEYTLPFGHHGTVRDLLCRIDPVKL